MLTHDVRLDRPRQRRSLAAFGLAGLCLLLPASPSGQTQTARVVSPASEETTLLAEGWAMLASGDALAASARGKLVLDRYPQSAAGLALAVEADIVRGHAVAGLTTYESWLGTRKLESPYLVRRIAIAYLREASVSTDARIRLAALKALAAEGDPEALAILAEATRKSLIAESAVMASLGDENAVKVLISQLERASLDKNLPMLKLKYIEALSSARSPLAVPPLMKILDATGEDWIITATVADALGQMHATEAIVKLRSLVDATHPGPLRWASAIALARMGDAGGTGFLREQLTSDLGDGLQMRAAEGLSFLGPNPDWMDTARRLATTGKPEVRSTAARIIAPYDHPLAQSTLDALLSDPNPAIREDAAQTLASKVAADFATLRRLLRSDGYNLVAAAGRITELTR